MATIGHGRRHHAAGAGARVNGPVGALGHSPGDYGAAFAIGTLLNLGFIIVEVTYGVLANSMALVADAGHNLGDVLGLLMAWAGAVLAKRAPSRTHTYGLRRATILAALANAMLLLVTVGAIAAEGLRRLADPGEVAGITVMAVAAIGIAVNGGTALLFASGRKGDINLRAAFLHMAYDALVSLGVVAAGGAILLTGWTGLDPLVSLAIAAVILAGTWGLLRDSAGMALDAVPTGIKLDEVAAFLKAQPGVRGIHDLHVWPMSTTETALTCHCLMPGGHPGDAFLAELAHQLQNRFGIGHSTIQVELDEKIGCPLEGDHLV
ncbi:MAG: cation diffusion facilitator family transporter [Beijerinckiaceae bacterium]|nr:cation diffusion facilitator family transporter [Beijerinckiaceae bacterium]